MWTKTAVELQPTDERPGGWHYAQVWKTGGGPIGFCTEHLPHPTEEEARLCYARYRRENLDLDGKWKDWGGCDVEGCDTPTKSFAQVRYEMFSVSLCDEHLSAMYAVPLLGLDKPAGDSMGS